MRHTGHEQETNAYRWIILAAAFVIVFMTIGARSTLGVFFKPIIAELGWNRGTISMVVAINIWLSGLLTPFTGYIMDRFGVKWLFTISVTLFGVGIGLIGLTHSVGYFLVVYGILIAVAVAGASITLTNVLVAQWFGTWRGLAIGINNAGMAIGQLSLVYVSSLLLTSFGWRLSHLYLGIAVLVVTVPMALLIPRHKAPVVSDSNAQPESQAAQGPLVTENWLTALRSLPLWQLNGGYFVCGMTVSLISLHFIPFVTDRGFPPATATRALSLMFGVSAFGSLLAGVVSDRIGRKNVLVLAYMIRAVAYALLLLWHHEIALYVFAVLNGLVWLATPPPITALTGEIYGMRALGTLSGISLLFHQIGSGASIWLGGVLYDLTGSYTISFILAIVALLGAAVVSLGIRERRYSVRYITPAPSVG